MRRCVAGLGAALLTIALLLACSATSWASEPDRGRQSAGTDPKIPCFPGLPCLPELPGADGGVLPSLSDCKESPTPEMPGNGLGGFFANDPATPPAPADPFIEGSKTTIYEQYGFAGLRWHTYDLGCGPDMMRQPDAVMGTAVSNWLMQAPIALTALTGSVTQVAFNPTFLDAFDTPMAEVSTVLHDNLFASWAPGMIAVLGILVLLRARTQALSTAAGAVGWAVLVVLVTTALFRWPVEAGNAADATVTETLGAVVTKLGGHEDLDPGTAVSSNVGEAILYRAWLAGTFGSPDSPTAEKYGPDVFKTQALTWREAELVAEDPEAGKELIEAKQLAFGVLAEQIRDEDPDAYEYLSGARSETRVGYSVVALLGTFLALPFLFVSALLMLGCFLIVRLAVMMFPAIAVLSLFPSTRGIVLGLGRTVGAAVVNAIIFGVGAGVTVAVLGVLFHPGGDTPGWLSLILMPVFSFMMWVALRPFRRLTSVVHRGGDPFGDMVGSFGRTSRSGSRFMKKAALMTASAYTGGAAAAAAASADAVRAGGDEQRPEARPTVMEPSAPALASSGRPAPDLSGGTAAPPSAGPAASHEPGRHRRADSRSTLGIAGPVPVATSSGVPPAPTIPEDVDGEEVYRIYRPATDQVGAQLGDVDEAS